MTAQISAKQLLAVGDAWDKISPCGRSILGTIGSNLGICPADPNAAWSDIAAHHRIEIAHRFYLVRDFLNKVLP